ncbi:uncharacterized protein BT62DRAFT_1003447 [Guyanagaster necrorhizus]|uniref:DUF202 domain-containing protein n=1 Tax=Guyanagaster necrorhizus TaxID=856835 RepID=A0A9P7VXI6_9AGAR|nr:uncharacterized protein BT62DRAFT_1003447 [Guyanagaster necrorhizus MCA 3950]KAG7448742.1 hypothetical protein BT62DRAFT_1003447 [Guyanagaster necrorhizus MCA 3950]
MLFESTTTTTGSSFVSLTLHNSGSVARDHLASERTFLAYVRTSLALASAGVALVQFLSIASIHPGRIQIYARPIGASTIVLAIVLLVIAVIRFFSVQTYLTRGLFPVARAFVFVVFALLMALIVVVFGALVSQRGS